MSRFHTLVEAVLSIHGQALEDPSAVSVALGTEDGQGVLLSAVRLSDDREGIEISVPVVDAPSAPSAPSAADNGRTHFWLLLHGLNYESRFVHKWRIVAGEDARTGLRQRLALDGLSPEDLALQIDEGIDRAAQLGQVLGDWAGESEGLEGRVAPPLTATMIRG